MITRSVKHILIPVDFSISTDEVIDKIIRLIEPFDSTIHLLHVTKPGRNLKNVFVNDDIDKHSLKFSEAKLCELQQKLSAKFHCIKVNVEIVPGKKIEDKIIEKANLLQAELVVIKKRNYKWFSFLSLINATRIAKETNAAVLIVNPKAIPAKIKSVVFPVHSFVSERYIQLLSTLTGKYKATIHLAAMYNSDPCNKSSVFIDTYRTLSDFLHYPLDYKVLSGNNFVKAVFNYGKNVMADLIFVNPFEETKINFINSNDVSNMISDDCKLCVLIANNSITLG